MLKDELSILRVEGKDDKHVIASLLKRHSIDPKAIDIKCSQDADDDSGGKDRLLRGMKTLVATSTGRSVGFVLDANGAVADRWRAVRNQLEGFGLELPSEIPDDGFVGDVLEVQARIGVWLMPNNQDSGAVEEFLRDLVDDSDGLLQHAKASTVEALQLGAAFAAAKQRKAELHAWLAWQERPGLPYGLAITAHYFKHDSPAALSFIDWFRRLFEATPESAGVLAGRTTPS